MPSKRKSRARSAESYVREARTLASIAPSLSKYKNRKKLKPHEKAAIARVSNRLKKSNLTPAQLIPLTKKQALKVPKGAKIGGGIRAIRKQEFIGPDQKLQIKRGKIIITGREGRRWHFERIETPSPLEGRHILIERAIELMEDATRQRKIISIRLWTVSGVGKRGLSNAGFTKEDFEELDQDIDFWASIDWGLSMYGDFNPILGLAYFYSR